MRWATGLPASSRQYTVTRASFETLSADRIDAARANVICLGALPPFSTVIDEPSIGLSPIMVQEVFGILQSLRDGGMTILLIEQNARQALAISDYGLVLEQGQMRIEDTAANVLADPRVAQLFLGGGLKS